MAAYSRIRPGAPGTTVRRHDRNGRAYFLHRETGKRVSRDVWQHERATLAFERGTVHATQAERRAVERTQAPFPEGVSPEGVPTRKPRRRAGGDGGEGGTAPTRTEADMGAAEGDWFDDLIDEGFEPFAVEGEDDT